MLAIVIAALHSQARKLPRFRRIPNNPNSSRSDVLKSSLEFGLGTEKVRRKRAGRSRIIRATAPAQLGLGRIRLDGKFRNSSAVLGDVADRDLILVGGESCQDFGLLALRDLDGVKGATEFCRDLIEFCRRDAEAPVRFLKTKRRRAGLGGRVLEGPT